MDKMYEAVGVFAKRYFLDAEARCCTSALLHEKFLLYSNKTKSGEITHETVQVQEVLSFGGSEIIMCEYIDMLEARGREIGEEIGEERGKGIGENRLARLIQELLKEQKIGDIALVSSDSRKRHELYQAYGI